MPLHASGIRHGESGLMWKGYSPGDKGNHWRTPTKGVMNKYIQMHNLISDWPSAYPSIQSRLNALDNAGLIRWSSKGVPRLKVYLEATSGVAATDLITDVPMASGNERMGYATQKPLALLERIISASSNPGDVVLDPFCGCATTLEAAHKLDRLWIGIDIAIHAVKRVARIRLTERLGLVEGQDFTVEGVPHTVEGAQSPVGARQVPLPEVGGGARRWLCHNQAVRRWRGRRAGILRRTACPGLAEHGCGGQGRELTPTYAICGR